MLRRLFAFGPLIPLDSSMMFDSKVKELDEALDTLDHLKKGSKDKKVLLVVTDGIDNSSRRSLANAVEEAQRGL